MKKVTDTLLFIASLFIATGAIGHSLLMEELRVPPYVRADTKDVILDCDYRLEEWEDTDTFVLQWHWNSVNLVYQWIPPQPPQALGNLRGRVDMSYRSSNDSCKMHKALRIPRPTADLSGIYSCKVSTFESEQKASNKMIVWSPPTHIKIEQWRPTENLVNFTCIADNISPVPGFVLFIEDKSGLRTMVNTINVVSHPGIEPGLLSVRASGFFEYYDTNRDSTLGCIVKIKGTSYEDVHRSSYNKDLSIISTTTQKSLPDEEAVKSPDFANLSSCLSYNLSYTILLVICTWSCIFHG